MTDPKPAPHPDETRSPGEDPGEGHAGLEGESQPGDAGLEDDE